MIILKGGFSTCGSRYKFEIKSYGAVTLFYSDYGLDSEDFWHESDLVTLENICREITAERVEKFWGDDINRCFVDPSFASFDDESKWGSEFYCKNAEAAGFEVFLELCVLTEGKITNPDDHLVVDSETDCAGVGLSECSYWAVRLNQSVEMACK